MGGACPHNPAFLPLGLRPPCWSHLHACGFYYCRPRSHRPSSCSVPSPFQWARSRYLSMFWTGPSAPWSVCPLIPIDFDAVLHDKHLVGCLLHFFLPGLDCFLGSCKPFYVAAETVSYLFVGLLDARYQVKCDPLLNVSGISFERFMVVDKPFKISVCTWLIFGCVRLVLSRTLASPFDQTCPACASQWHSGHGFHPPWPTLRLLRAPSSLSQVRLWTMSRVLPSASLRGTHPSSACAGLRSFCTTSWDGLRNPIWTLG